MKAEELPLYELFTRLQEAGLPLGLNEYTQAVKALQAGFGLPDRYALSRLCKTLWIKNKEEEYIFNYHFAKLISSKSISCLELKNQNTEQSRFLRESAQIQKRAARITRVGLTGAMCALAFWGITFTGYKFWLRLTEPPQASPSQENPWQVSVDFLNSLAGIGMIGLGSGLSWLLIRQIRNLQNTTLEDNAEITVFPKSIFKPEITDSSGDEIQLAEAIRSETEKHHQSFNTNIKVLGRDEYFPLTRRQMKQGWRYLRRNSREGPKTEFDVEGTVAQIGMQGLFLAPVMRAQLSNRADLVVLIDCDGSMVPFQGLSHRLIDTAKRAGRLGNASVYFFRNCPVRYLYQDPLMQKPESVHQFLKGRLSPKSVVMIVSDAGAARGSLNPSRLRKTQTFLAQLNLHVRYVVWLNPLPRRRWKDTTAFEIAHLVPMFEINRAGFRSAIDVSKGRWKPEARFLERKI